MEPLPILRCFACAAICAALPAQTVTTSVSALTPIPCAVTAGGLTTTQILPAGPLANFGSSGANAPGTPVSGQALLGWTAGASATQADFRLTLQTSLNGATTARLGPAEMLVTFTGSSPATMPIRYHGDLAFSGVVGSTAWIRVDVANDGTIDWQGGQGPLVGTVADLVAQPLQLRILFDDLRVVAGQGIVQLSLRVTPDHGIHVIPMATNCGLSHVYSVEPLFDTTFADVQFRSQYTTWHVLGLEPLPQLLPPALTLTAQPCFAVPSPDFVVRTGTLYLPIPAAVRPVVLYSQLVELLPYVRVSDTFQVIAL